MARHHMTSNGPVPYTPEEEAARDAQEEAEAAKAALKIRAAILDQITLLERDSMLNRGSRELEIVNMQDIATRKAEKFKAENPSDPRTNEQLAAEYLAATPYYSKLTALDAQIAILRGQIGA